MRSLTARLSIAFTAGLVGAIANSLAVQLGGMLRGVGAPPLTPPWIYQRLVWGGIWGFLFLLPVLRDQPVLRGLLLGIAPALARLTLFAPAGADANPANIAQVFLFNAIWGVTAALWFHAAIGRDAH